MSRKQRPATAQTAVIDACCLIDLLASGQAESILRGTGYTWYLPTAVRDEVKFVREHDPESPGLFKIVQADLRPLIGAGLLSVCQPDHAREAARFIHFAGVFRSEGEAMCLAIAECRHWTVATDDRKAIRIAREAGMSVVSCPALIKNWAITTRPSATKISQVLSEIQFLAQFRPNPSMPEYDWWVSESARS